MMMMPSGPNPFKPIQVLKGGAEEEKAETARLSSFVGAIAVGDLIKSTLGPKGMDKILLCEDRRSSKVEITNDGATILKSIGVDNPAAKVLVDISKVNSHLFRSRTNLTRLIFTLRHKMMRSVTARLVSLYWHLNYLKRLNIL